MSKFSDIKTSMSRLERLEREMDLKQLQINRLLSITQAINSNVSAKELYQMYQSFLSWELSIKKLAFYVRGEKSWNCEAFIGIDESLLQHDITSYFDKYSYLKNVEDNDHPLIREFDVVIPVKHKEHPIAYVFIGGFNDEYYCRSNWK